MFRKKFQDANLMLRIGLVLFVLANVMALTVHPSARLGDGWLDGVKGFLYGLAIALLALSIRLRSRKCQGDSA